MSLHDYLTTPAAAAMGRPDAVLVVSSARFPVHKQFLSACCSTLGDLMQEYGGSEEVVLFPASHSAPATPTQASRTPNSRSAENEGLAERRQSTRLPALALEWMASPANFSIFLHQLYCSARQGCSPASEEQARMLVQMADYWGASCLLPGYDSFLAMHLRTQRTELMDRAGPLQPTGFNYSVSAKRLLPYLELASRHRLRRLMAECMPFLWELSRDEAAPLLRLLDGPVTAALIQFIFIRKQEYQGAPPGSCGCRECGAIQHVKFDVPVGTGSFAHRCTDCKLKIRSQRRIMADEVEEFLSQEGWRYT